MTRIEIPIDETPVEEPKPEPSGATYEVVDEFTIRQTRPVVVETESHNFDLDFLYQQRIDITRQRDEMISAKTRELAEVEELIAAAEAVGVKSRKAEAVGVKSRKAEAAKAAAESPEEFSGEPIT